MLELNEEQHRLVASGDRRIHDGVNGSTYVLVNEETYQRIADLLDTGPLSDVERRTILQGVWQRAGWDDPKMDEYDALPESA
jgi:hypothetical protein